MDKRMIIIAGKIKTVAFFIIIFLLVFPINADPPCWAESVLYANGFCLEKPFSILRACRRRASSIFLFRPLISDFQHITYDMKCAS
jgi:hypothetical protein